MLTHIPGSPPLSSSSDQSGESVESLDINRIIGELIQERAKPRSKSLYARVKRPTKLCDPMRRRRNNPETGAPKTDDEAEQQRTDEHWPDCQRRSTIRRSFSNPIISYNNTNF
jgi:hypothetical protein